MNHFISLEQAVQMTTTYRENKERILQEEFQGTDLLAKAETFDRAAFDKLLAQEGCEKVRIYYGMDAELKVHAIIVGVNAEGRDILPAASTVLTTEDGAILSTESGEFITTDDDTVIIEFGQRCPPDCIESPLNP